MATGTSVLLKCGSCSKEILANEPKINCNGLCNMFYHKQCLKLTREKVKILLETPNFKWFCDHCNESSSVVYALLIKLQDTVNQLNNSVQQQIQVIKNQENKILELENNISSLTSIKEQKYAAQNKDNTMYTTTSTNRFNNSDNNKTRNLPKNISRETQRKQVTNQEPDVTTNNTKTTEDKVGQRKETHNSNKNHKNESHIVQSNRRPKRQFVEGTNKDSSIKAVNKNAWIFVTRLDKETTANQIEALLSSICEVKCEKLNLRHNEKWSSFRICAPFHLKDRITDGNIWPSGAQIGRYFFPKDKMKPETMPKESNEDFLDTTVTDNQNS